MADRGEEMKAMNWKTNMTRWMQLALVVGWCLIPALAGAMTFEDETADKAVPVVEQPTPAASAALEALAKGDIGSEDTHEPELAGAVPLGKKSSGGERGILSLLAMGLLGVGAFVTLMLLKKKRKGSPEEEALKMAVLQTIRVGAKHQISMIRVPGATLVVGLTEKGIETLAELPELAREERAPADDTILQAIAEKDTLATRVEEDDSNPFLDRVLGKTNRETPIFSSGYQPKDVSTDSGRRAVLRQLEQYRQTL